MLALTPENKATRLYSLVDSTPLLYERLTTVDPDDGAAIYRPISERL